MLVGFYDDQRWCSRCGTYVHYLEGLPGAFCAECGNRVRLFRRSDWRRVLGGKMLENAPLPDDPGRRPGQRRAG